MEKIIKFTEKYPKIYKRAKKAVYIIKGVAALSAAIFIWVAIFNAIIYIAKL